MRRSESSERKAARTRRVIDHVAKPPYAFGRLRR